MESCGVMWTGVCAVAWNVECCAMWNDSGRVWAVTRTIPSSGGGHAM